MVKRQLSCSIVGHNDYYIGTLAIGSSYFDIFLSKLPCYGLTVPTNLNGASTSHMDLDAAATTNVRQFPENQMNQDLLCTWY